MGSKKTKKYEPKNIEDLADMFYNPDRYDDKKKYQNGLAMGILTEAFERQIFNLINIKIIKIDEVKDIKTPDYISEDRKIIIEATSIFMPPIQGEVIDRDESERWHRGTKRIDKINETINHAIEKDYQYLSEKFGYDKTTGQYLLFVQVDCLIEAFYKFYSDLETAVKSSIFHDSDLSGIIFITESSEISRKIAFIKKGVKIPCGWDIQVIFI